MVLELTSEWHSWWIPKSTIQWFLNFCWAFISFLIFTRWSCFMLFYFTLSNPLFSLAFLSPFLWLLCFAKFSHVSIKFTVIFATSYRFLCLKFIFFVIVIFFFSIGLFKNCLKVENLNWSSNGGGKRFFFFEVVLCCLIVLCCLTSL